MFDTTILKHFFSTSYAVPSLSPSDVPSDIPSYVLSDVPSDVPSDTPSDVPSNGKFYSAVRMNDI